MCGGGGGYSGQTAKASVGGESDSHGHCQTPSPGLRHSPFKEEGAGKRCSECGSLQVVVVCVCVGGVGGGGGRRGTAVRYPRFL